MRPFWKKNEQCCLNSKVPCSTFCHRLSRHCCLLPFLPDFSMSSNARQNSLNISMAANGQYQRTRAHLSVHRRMAIYIHVAQRQASSRRHRHRHRHHDHRHRHHQQQTAAEAAAATIFQSFSRSKAGRLQAKFDFLAASVDLTRTVFLFYLFPFGPLRMQSPAHKISSAASLPHPHPFLHCSPTRQNAAAACMQHEAAAVLRRIMADGAPGGRAPPLPTG